MVKKSKDEDIIVPSGLEEDIIPASPLPIPPIEVKNGNGKSQTSLVSTPTGVDTEKNFKDKFDEASEEQDDSLKGLDQELGTSSLRLMAEQVVNPPGLAEEMFNTDKDIESKTRLTPELVAQVAIAKTMSLAHNIPMLEDFANTIMKLRISLLGEGRKEGVDMVKGQNLVGFTNDMAARTKG